MLIYYLPLSEFDAIVPREQKQAHSTLNKKNFVSFVLFSRQLSLVTSSMTGKELEEINYDK
jgi:hypothetical protein